MNHALLATFWSAHQQLPHHPLDARLEHLQQLALDHTGAEEVAVIVGLQDPDARWAWKVIAERDADGISRMSSAGTRMTTKAPKDAQVGAATLAQRGERWTGWIAPEAKPDMARVLGVRVSGGGEAPGEEALGEVREVLSECEELLDRLTWSHGWMEGQQQLSPRDRETLREMLDGASEREIAEALEITPASAHQYVLRVYKKLGVSSRAQLLHAWMTNTDRHIPFPDPVAVEDDDEALHIFWRTVQQQPLHPPRAHHRAVFQALCKLVAGHNVLAIPTLRHAELPEDDILLGWRSFETLYYLGDATFMADAVALQVSEDYKYEPGVQAMVRLAGSHRAYTTAEAIANMKGPTEEMRALLNSHGIGDRLTGVHTLGEDVELYLSMDRLDFADPFSQSDCDRLRAVLPHLGAFARRLMLCYGLLPGQEPLTPRERETLDLMLGGLTEREIAEALEITPASAHQYIQTVHKKLNVSSRRELIHLWLDP